MFRYLVDYRECNLTPWHKKHFICKWSAKRFCNKLIRKHYDDIVLRDKNTETDTVIR